MIDKLDSYFELREQYMDYLIAKGGFRLMDDSKHYGMYNEYGHSFDADSDISHWQHLSNIEDRCKFYKIALLVMSGNDVKVKLRSGSSLSIASITDATFPKMTIERYANDVSYGRDPIGEEIFIWDCNELQLEHNTDDSKCWCDPVIEDYRN